MSRRWLFWPAAAPPTGGGLLTHFNKTSNAVQTTTSLSAVELTTYTVSWSDLTSAGFAAGDEVAIILAFKHWNSNNNANNRIAFTHGTTFAGSSTFTPGAELRAESPTATAGEQTLWVGQEALVTNENIYVSALVVPASTASFNEFVCLVLKLDDLAANDWLYTTVTHTGGATAPTTYDTTGAGTTIPATGDWLLIGGTRFFSQDLSSDMLVAIHDGAGDIAEVSSQCEDASDFRIISTMAYRAGLTGGTTVRTRYRAVLGTSIPQLTHTWLFGLRLDAFADHWGAHTTNTVTHTAVDTPLEFAGNGAYSKGATGPFVILGWPITNVPELAKRPYGRIQIGSSDWPATDANRQAIADNGTTAKVAPLLYGYNAAQASGTLDIDLDCAEDNDASPNPTCTEQIAVAFSLELA